MKFSEDELGKKIASVREEISSLESIFDINNGNGFGGGISDERQLNYQIQYKKDQVSFCTLKHPPICGLKGPLWTHKNNVKTLKIFVKKLIIFSLLHRVLFYHIVRL
jgi:hypothetical protein